MQGHALSVLKASSHILQTVKAIYTEVGFVEAYEGQPQYEQVKAWLEEQGFEEVGRDFEDQQQWFFGNMLFAKN